MRPNKVETVAVRRLSIMLPFHVLGRALSPGAPCRSIVQCSSLMRFEHFGRGGGFLFCGTTNKKFLKFLKFDFEVLHPRLL